MFYFISILFLIILIFIIITSNKIFKSLVTRKLRNLDESYDYYISNNLLNETFYNSISKEDIQLTSLDGLKLSGFLVKNKNKSNKYIILAHGVSIGYVGSLKYIEFLYNDGFNILIIHQRRHGKSQGKYSTYGYLEKHDLNLWINYLIDRFGNDIFLGLHGESMGAGTVMEAIPLNNSIRFVIEDCGYSDLYELMKYLIRKDYPRVLHYPLYVSLAFTNILIIIKAKFSMKKVSPIEIVKTTDIPIMFIHGRKDYFVPCYMCEDLYNAKLNGLRKILIIDNAAHAESIVVNRTTYETEVLKFINRCAKL